MLAQESKESNPSEDREIREKSFPCPILRQGTNRQMSNSSGDSGFISTITFSSSSSFATTISSNGGVYVNNGKIFVSAMEPDIETLSNHSQDSQKPQFLERLKAPRSLRIFENEKNNPLNHFITRFKMGSRNNQTKNEKSTSKKSSKVKQNDTVYGNNSCTAIMENDEIILAAYLASIDRNVYELPSNEVLIYHQNEKRSLRPFLVGARLGEMPEICWAESLVAMTSTCCFPIISSSGYNRISIYSSAKV